MENLLCSNCFKDEGLRIDAFKLGEFNDSECPNCKSVSGSKLNKFLIEIIADRFFVRGSFQKSKYGGSPIIQFNEHHYGQNQLNVTADLAYDSELISQTIQIGFFYYGPRLWMLGQIEPLENLQDAITRRKVINQIVNRYPKKELGPGEKIYRLRKNLKNPILDLDFDSPPDEYLGTYRLDSFELPVLYTSQDLEVCVHECRVTIEDDLFVGTLQPLRRLKLLDLTKVLEEDNTEFESIDMAVHMLFSAGMHSYEISRDIAKAAKELGFDGIIYPSFFSDVRTGNRPLETILGVTIRKFEQYKQHVQLSIIPNLGIFGRPVKEGLINVTCINRLVLNRIKYEMHFGPVNICE